MIRWLRWQGLIAFVVVLAVLFIFWFFLADRILKKTIESTGTRMVGAKLELAKADLRLFPLGVSLTGLQIANPEKPMSNVVQAEKIDFAMDSLNLLRRKVIIDAMTVAGVRFNTPRKTSGAIIPKTPQKPPPKDKPASLKMPAFHIPDVKDILAKEKLESLELINRLRTDIGTSEAKWRQRIEQLPDQRTFEQYQKQIEKLSQKAETITGALSAAGDIQKMQKDIDRDLKHLKKIRKNFLKERDTFKRKIAQLKSAPRKDIDRILNTYSLSSSGMGNVARLLFGEKVGGSVEKAIYWYNKIKPFVKRSGEKETGETQVQPARGKGVNVKFAEKEPLPDFLVRRTSISLTFPAGDMQGEIRNVTREQDLLGQPLTFSFTGDGLQDIQSVDIQGALDRLDPHVDKDTLALTMKQYRVKDLVLSAGDQLPLSIKNGLAHVSLMANLQNDILDADLKTTLNSVQMETGSKADADQLQQALQSALADVSEFYLKAQMSGPLDDYKIKLTSDLDKVLGNAVRKQIKALSSQFQKKLRKSVMQKIKGPLAEVKSDFSGLEKLDQDFISRLNLGKDVSEDLVQKLGDKVKLSF